MGERKHRRRAYVKIATSVIREPWDDQVLATFVRLCAWLSDRWARDQLSAEEACSAVLSRHDLAVITGRAQLVHSRRALYALGEHVSCTLNARGDYTELLWPKFAEFQELPGRIARRSPVSAPAPAPAPAPALKEQRKGSKRSKQESLFDDQVRGLSELLAKRLRETDPGARVPSGLSAWDKAISEINVPAIEVADVIEWVFSSENRDSQFAFRVHSGSALRDKFSKIRDQIERNRRAKDKSRGGRVEAAVIKIAGEQGIALAGKRG